MSCCPKPPPSSRIHDITFDPNSSEASAIRPDEPIECAIARSGNPTGKHDDATDYPQNKIENSNIVCQRQDASCKIDETFKLTDSSTKTAATWEASPSIPGVTLTGNKLSGTVDKSALDKTFNVKVTAKDSSGAEIDTRTFTVTPTIEKKGDELRLISPLPGAMINSRFGMRMHPIQKVLKFHSGIDMVMPNRSVSDVVSAADGEVIFAGGNRSTGYGLNVKVKHSDSQGRTIAITTYNHLQEIYVSSGQKLMAGQKLGKEGSTGGSTGNHLHFEVKTPEGKFLDPEPYISGNMKVAGKTNSDGTPDPASVQTKQSKNASLTAKETKAKDGCPPMSGPKTPSDPQVPNPLAPLPNTPPSTLPPGNGGRNKTKKELFAIAWQLAMKREVGPHWGTEPRYSPGDPELEAGLIGTEEQRKKVGFKNWSAELGGTTKFGITAKSGSPVPIKDLTYAQALELGYNRYWVNRDPDKAANNNPYLGIMLFDIRYMSGSFPTSKYTNMPPMSREEQLVVAEQLNNEHMQYLQGLSGWTVAHNGWKTRAEERIAFVKGLNL